LTFSEKAVKAKSKANPEISNRFIIEKGLVFRKKCY